MPKSTIDKTLPVTEHHQKSYGRFGHDAPVGWRCCVRVRGAGRWPTYAQCPRSRGHGPEAAYCAQHDPDRIEAKRVADRQARDLENKRRAASRITARVAREGDGAYVVVCRNVKDQCVARITVQGDNSGVADALASACELDTWLQSALQARTPE